mmetsp:Transcript_1035/g.4434  ORF Transcript_1035/g.4434 Transcript_1035/m.4434 type:complete len:271 (+) Transcript_1035:297-1109(+)
MAHENPHSYRDGNGDADHEEADIEGRVLGLGLVARVLLALGVFKGELREVEAADHAGLVPPRRRGDVVVNVLQDSRMLHVGVEKLLGFCADLGEERLALHHPSREHDPLGRYQQHRSGTEPSHGVREDIPHLLIVRKRGQLGWIAAVKRGESSAGADSLNAVAVKHAGAGEVIRVIGPAGHLDVAAFRVDEAMDGLPIHDEPHAHAGAHRDIHTAGGILGHVHAELGQRRRVHIRVEAVGNPRKLLSEEAQDVRVDPLGFRGVGDEAVRL